MTNDVIEGRTFLAIVDVLSLTNDVTEGRTFPFVPLVLCMQQISTSACRHNEAFDIVSRVLQFTILAHAREHRVGHDPPIDTAIAVGGVV